MFVGPGFKVGMQINNVRHQARGKILHIDARPLPIQKLLPRSKEIFQRNDSIVAITALNSDHNPKEKASTHTHTRIVPLLIKVKNLYVLWYGYYQILPKAHRHSLGQRIDTLFVETIEAVTVASFLSPKEKAPYVRLAIKKLDTLRILLMVLWETKSLEDKQYIALSVRIEEVGKMLGGWIGQLVKQNSPTYAGEK